MDQTTEKPPGKSAGVSETVTEFDRQAAETWATSNDVRDMDALGLKPTFKRRFVFMAMVGFTSIVVVAWENMLAVFHFALYNGGTGGLFWGFIFSLFGMTLVYLTIAELSSSFPTAGGQYQWVAECAPPSMRKIIAYCTGWSLTLAWMSFLAAGSTIVGNLIKFCILIYHPNSAAANSQWLPTLIALVVLICSAVFNIYAAKRLPAVQGFMLFIHLVSWLATVVTLWSTTGSRGNARDVLLTFSNPGGWPNAGVASIVGLLTPWSTLIGYDSSVHMTENAKDASRTIPLALLSAYALNTCLSFIAATTMLFCIGDLESVLASFSPFVQVFLNSTGSKSGTILLLVPIIIAFFGAIISEVATSKRQLWSFARDGGLPAGHRLVPVPDGETPRRAVWATITLSFLICCINFGPVVGFNAIFSLVVSALTFSYSITIACMIWRRFFGRRLPKERFNLGPAGGVINIAALCCTLPATVLTVFPSVPDPGAEYMNWAVLVYGFVTLVAVVNYVFSGRRNFNPPLRKLDD